MRVLKRFLLIGVMVMLVMAWMNGWLWWSQEESPWNTSHSIRKHVILLDDGIRIEAFTSADRVDDFLREQEIKIGDADQIFPDKENRLTSGMVLRLDRAKTISVKTKDGGKQFQTFQKTVENALDEQGILLDENDFALPGRDNPVQDGMKVTVVRVNVEEKTIDKPIAFETVLTEDDKLSWRKKITDQKGENGIKRFVYKIWSHDGKEVDRKLLSQEVAKQPVTEKITQGTFVQVGKAHTGLGTWYAYTGTLAAASPWLPMGSFVKVTNRDNGKTVIVKINDRGPFGKNRILDLDKVAFEKIASLGAGVINLKVEEITN